MIRGSQGRMAEAGEAGIGPRRRKHAAGPARNIGAERDPARTKRNMVMASVAEVLRVICRGLTDEL